MQCVFSAIFYFAPIALYQGWLMAGYATVYTMAPVFSLVLDRDVSEDLALLYPELYKDLVKVCYEMTPDSSANSNLLPFYRAESCHTRRSSCGSRSVSTKVRFHEICVICARLTGGK